MKKLIFLCFIIFVALSTFAQQPSKFDKNNSFAINALVIYDLDSNGFYQARENVDMEELTELEDIYAYNKKTQELYCTTRHSNCVIRLHNNYAKFYQKQKSIPKLIGKELESIIEDKNKVLEKIHANSNEKRQEIINAARKKAIADSIKKATEDSLRIVEEKNKEINYRKNHIWYKIPTKKNGIYCEFCEKMIEGQDTVYCYAIKNDTIYWAGFEKGKLDLSISHIHAGKLPYIILKDDDFVYHRKLFNDSLTSCVPISIELAKAQNLNKYVDYLKDLKRIAPNGFFLNWGWDSEYSSIEFNFRYMNTNKNTIKYIEVFFVVTNDVGDVRKTGSFKGTGPLEEWESASWEWDHSSYYVAGDASKMNITKVIITYMNGTKVTIPKNKLLFE